jgi:hypothetical protein
MSVGEWRRVALAHAIRSNEHPQSAQDAGFMSSGRSITKDLADLRVSQRQAWQEERFSAPPK